MLKLEPVARTDVGRRRKNNEDYLGDFIIENASGRYSPGKLAEKGQLFAVADGMGGYESGEVASELAVKTLFDEYYRESNRQNLGQDLLQAVQAANRKVFEAAMAVGGNRMGSTLVAVVLTGNKAIFANVGDSRAYIMRQGLPERVTRDHSMVQDQVDAGLITQEEAETSRFRNIVTRAIGPRPDVEIDLFEREVFPEDVILISSDGLHGLVKELEMSTVVATAPSLENAAGQLIDMANQRGGPDNISVVLVKVVEPGEPLPPVLNELETKYNPPVISRSDSIFSQSTAQTGPLAAFGDDSNKFNENPSPEKTEDLLALELSNYLNRPLGNPEARVNGNTASRATTGNPKKSPKTRKKRGGKN